jgi:thiamine transport system permease protein
VSIRARYLLIAPPLIFLGVFYFYPLISIFGLSFSPEASGYGSGLGKLFAKGYHARVLWFTTWQAALSTLLTLVCALPGAYVFATYRFRGKNLIQALTAIPFVLPTVVTAAAFKALLGDSGLANRWLMGIFGLEDAPIRLDHTVWFFLLAMFFITTPWCCALWADSGPACPATCCRRHTCWGPRAGRPFGASPCPC